MRARLFAAATLLCVTVLSSPAPARAAAPAVANNTSGTNASGTSHTYNLASGGSNGHGHLICAGYSGNQTGTWPAGWTLVTQKTFAGTGNARLEAYYHIHNGSTPSSISVSTGGNVASAYRAYRITGVHASSTATCTAADGNGGTGTNFPPHTASWGAEENLWLLCAAHQSDTVNSYPTNYTANGVNQNCAAAACGVATPIARIRSFRRPRLDRLQQQQPFRRRDDRRAPRGMQPRYHAPRGDRMLRR
jgi:hypothetical protein